MFILPTDSPVTLSIAGPDASADQPRGDPSDPSCHARYRDTSRPETRQIPGVTLQIPEENRLGTAVAKVGSAGRTAGGFRARTAAVSGESARGIGSSFCRA